MLTIEFDETDTYSPYHLINQARFLLNMAGYDIGKLTKCSTKNLIEEVNNNKDIEIENKNTNDEDDIDDAIEENFEAPINTDVKPANEIFKHTNSLETDINNLPWDSRIHSGNRTKLNNGAWKYKRGLDIPYIETVEKELKQIMQAPMIEERISIPLAPANLYAVPPSPQVPSNENNFVSLMFKISGSIQNNKLNPERANELAKSLGLPDIAAIAKRPDLISALDKLIDKEIGA